MIEEVVQEIKEHAYLWGDIVVRQSYPGTAHRDTNSIFIRGPRVMTPYEYQETLTAYDYPAASILPKTTALVQGALDLIGAKEIGYVIIANLMPGGTISPHIDEGAYADHYQRFHVPLLTNDECGFFIGGQLVSMPLLGTVYRFEHKQEHSAFNYGDTERWHIIIDAVVENNNE